MKKMLIMLLAAIMALSATAFAATYNYDNDITFEYDEKNLEITFEEHKDDEDRIILGFKNKAWGDGYITIQYQELPESETGSYYPTWEEIAEGLGTEELENLPTWGNFTDVITASTTTEGLTETTFIAPVFDDDGSHADMLTVVIGTTQLDDEDAATARDDAISTVVDTLKIDE